MTKSLGNFLEIFIFALLLGVCGLLLTNASYSIQVLKGIELWAAVVLPSLFPYFFITAVLSSLNITSKLALKLSPVTNKLFLTGGISAYALFMSVISGYPIGAKIVADLREKGLLGEYESVRASAFCSTSSPMFTIGSVGNITFGSTVFGIKLFICNVLVSFCVGIIFSFYRRNDKKTITSDNNLSLERLNKTDDILYESVFSAVNSILFVGGIISLFYLFTEILLSLGVLSPLINLISLMTNSTQSLSRGIAVGLFESTKGLKLISECGMNFFTLPIASTICCFGGLSVIFQSVAFLGRAKIKVLPFVLAKILSLGLGFLFGIIMQVI